MVSWEQGREERKEQKGEEHHVGKKIPTNMKSVLIFQSAGELDKEGATTQME